MESKNKISTLKVFRIIVIKYIIGMPLARILMFPIFLMMILGKHLQIKVTEFNKEIANFLTNKSDLKNTEVVYTYFINFMVGLTLNELQGVFFASAIEQTLRYSLKDTFAHFIKMEVKEFNDYGCGAIQTIINRKGKAISELIEIVVLYILPIILTLSFVLASVAKTTGKTAAVITFIFVSIYIVITIKIALSRNIIRSNLNKAENRSSNALYDSLSNHEAVSCFNGQDHEIMKYDNTLIDVEKLSVNLFSRLYLLNFYQKTVFCMLNSTVLAFGVYQSGKNRMEHGTWNVFGSLSRSLLSGLNNLGWTYCRFGESITNAKDAFSEIEAVRPITSNNTIDNFKNSIRFDNVYFSYANKAILKGTSFTINRGDKVALIGTNGAGKSTILKTLLKFNNYIGNIYIDDKNINTITQESFRRFVGYVPQNPSLFNNTVAYNIKYGKQDMSDEEVITLAKKFQIHDSLKNLERGYLTQAGEGGKYLSGGERQRVAILRALVKESQILIMDEPTSNLDKESEYEIMSRIMSMSSELTVLAIVHNPELLTFFNKICFLDQGVVKIYEDFEVENIGALMTLSKNS